MRIVRSKGGLNNVEESFKNFELSSGLEVGFKIYSFSFNLNVFVYKIWKVFVKNLKDHQNGFSD